MQYNLENKQICIMIHLQSSESGTLMQTIVDEDLLSKRHSSTLYLYIFTYLHYVRIFVVQKHVMDRNLVGNCKYIMLLSMGLCYAELYIPILVICNLIFYFSSFIRIHLFQHCVYIRSAKTPWNKNTKNSVII